MSIAHRARIVAVIFTCLIYAPAFADDVVRDQGDDAPIDLNEQVEIQVNGGLRSNRVTEHGVSISLRNISEKDIHGPFGVTIDGTGMDELQVVFPEVDGVPTNYYQVMPETAVLRAGQTSRPVRIEFRSGQALTFLDRNNFSLNARVVRPEDVKGEAVATAPDAEMVPGKDYSWAEMYDAFAVQEQWTPFLLENEGVVATGTSEDDAGNLVIRVYTTRHGIIQELPGNLGGMDLQQEVVGGHFVARPAQGGVIRPGGGQAVSPDSRRRLRHGLGGHVLDFLPLEGNPGIGTDPSSGDGGGATTPPMLPDDAGSGGDVGVGEIDMIGPVLPDLGPSSGPGGDPTIRFPRPVPIGVSTFNINDTCASGTIGCRCIDSAGNVYGLSNNHVWAAMNSGAPADVAMIGDPIVQPGLGDHFPPCMMDPFDIIGFLADYEPYDLTGVNVMDAALMSTTPAFLAGCTPDDGYGFPSSDPVGSPYLGLEVQKSGRTTLFTRGKIVALNVSSPIGGTTFFENMIEVHENGSLFGGPGDSGSLIVTFPDRRPVALLFAGGGSVTLANPIIPVLERFNVIIDDGSLTPAPAVFPVSGRIGTAVGPAPSDDVFFLP